MSVLAPLYEYKSFGWQQRSRHDRSYEAALVSNVDDFRFEGDAEPEISIQSVQLATAGTSIHRVRSTGHMITVQQDSNITAMFPLRGRQIVDGGDDMLGASAEGSLTLRPSRRTTWVKPQKSRSFEAVMLKVPEEVVVNRGFLAPMKRGTLAALVETEPHAAPALSDLIRYILTDLGSARPILNSPGACLSMETLLWEHFRVFLAVSGTAETGLAAEGAARVREAIDFMQAHFDEALSVEAIAVAVGTTARSLQSDFRKFSGQTPWEKLTAIRLEAARYHLLSAGHAGSVTAVAMNCGFSHLGRFAALYRRTYGEPPSETLARVLRK